jgi:hypothetical protein
MVVLSEPWRRHSCGVMFCKRKYGMKRESFSQKIGFLRTGWWIVHLTGIAVVYALGHLLWR